MNLVTSARWLRRMSLPAPEAESTGWARPLIVVLFTVPSAVLIAAISGIIADNRLISFLAFLLTWPIFSAIAAVCGSVYQSTIKAFVVTALIHAGSAFGVAAIVAHRTKDAQAEIDQVLGEFIALILGASGVIALITIPIAAWIESKGESRTRPPELQSSVRQRYSERAARIYRNNVPKDRNEPHD